MPPSIKLAALAALVALMASGAFSLPSDDLHTFRYPAGYEQ
jgi:hypothetical protein